MWIYGDWWPGTSAYVVLVMLILLIVGIVVLGLLYGESTNQLKAVKTATSTLNTGPPKVNYFHNLNTAQNSVSSAYNAYPARVLFIGDNMTGQGYDSNFAIDYKQKSLPAYFAFLNGSVQNRSVMNQNFFGFESASLDKRVTMDSSWAADTSPLGGVGGHMIQAKTNGTITFKTDMLSTNANVDVYAYQQSSPFTVKIGTQAAVTVTPGSLSAISGQIVKQTVTYTNNYLQSTPVIVIQSTGATTVRPVSLFGLSYRYTAYDEVINCGYDANSTQAVNNSTITGSIGAGILALAPSVVVVNIGSVDFKDGTSQQTYIGNMQNLFNFFKNNNIPFLVMTPPWQTTSSTDLQTSYVAALKSSMDASNVPYIDFQAEMQSLGVQQNLGMSMSSANGMMTFVGALKGAQDVMVALTGAAPQ